MRYGALPVLFGLSLPAAVPAQAAAGCPLVVADPGFEDDGDGWAFTDGTGVAGDNPHGGGKAIYLTAGPGKKVSQMIPVKAGGGFAVSAWIATGAPGGTFTVLRNGVEAGSVALPERAAYSRYTISGVRLGAGDRLEIAFGSGAGWVNADDVMISPVALHRPRVRSSDAAIAEMFDWAADKARSWAHQYGVPGPLNVDERVPAGTGTGVYTAAYWAGYAHRSGYYSRDFAHQLAGAHILGLAAANKTMLRSFAATATAAHKYYPVWALNFDGVTPLAIDYRSPASFVREVPAVFELVEKANQAFRWTGDRSYLDDPVLWDYYTHATGPFVDLHDTLIGNGRVRVAEGTGRGIFQGAASYNEVGGEPLAEAGDAIGAQYQAYRAMAELAADKHDRKLALRYAAKARDLKRYFNDTWSREPGGTGMVRGYTVKGEPLTGFGKENSWFMPMKGIIEPGPRNDAYLDFIDAEAQGADAPRNIEAITYLPDTFFRHHRGDLAWKWMRHVYDQREARHVNPRQGRNGDYPEVPFTLVGQTVEGLMGIEPDAPRRTVATLSRLPAGIGWLEVAGVPFGDGEVSVRHDGHTATTFTNGTARATWWEARFPGGHERLEVDGRRVHGRTKVVDGLACTVAVIPVRAGQTVKAEAAS